VGSNIPMNSMKREGKSDTEKAVADLLSDLLPLCSSCGPVRSRHEYALLASQAIVPDSNKTLLNLFQAIKNHDWLALRAYQTWLGNADDVEIYGIRCLNGGITIVVIKTHFELLHGAQLLYSEVLSKQETENLLAIFAGSRWHQM
jgi:hypothetical protein